MPNTFGIPAKSIERISHIFIDHKKIYLTILETKVKFSFARASTYFKRVSKYTQLVYKTQIRFFYLLQKVADLKKGKVFMTSSIQNASFSSV